MNRRDFLKNMAVVTGFAAFKGETQSTLQNQAERRVEVWDNFSKAADEIVRKVEDKDMNEIWKFIQDHGILAVPSVGGDYHGAGTRKKLPAIALIPLLDEDKKIPVWGNLIKGRIAAYIMPNRFILLDSSAEFSDTWKGLILLHESTHAFMFEINPRSPDKDDPDYINNQERDVREHMKRIIIKLGGFPYQKLLDEEAAYIKKMAEDHPTSGDIWIPDPRPYNNSMDKIFGPAQSDGEKDTRATEFYVQACFAYLDQYHGREDITKLKSRVVRGVKNMAMPLELKKRDR